MSTLADLQKRNIAQMEVAAAAEQDANSQQDPGAGNNTTILQSDKPTDRQTSQQTNKHTDRQADQPTIKQTRTPTNQQTDGQAKKRTARLPPAPEPPARPEIPARPVRVDGRTLRPRQDTADQTMVTSMRLAVSTLELLDDYCYRHRQRKQDVVQAALDLYFDADESE